MTGACPLCGKSVAEQFRPFCSSRCSMIDLGQWLGESYRIPVSDAEADDALRTDFKDNQTE